MKRMWATAFAAAILLTVLATGAWAEEKDPYPFLDADIYFHALYVTQENFRVENGVFGDSFHATTGNFSDQFDAEQYKHVVESRFRLFLTPVLSEDVKARFTVEVNPEYGREQGFGDFRVNNASSGTGELRIKHFYVEAEHDVGGQLGYRIGRQGYGTPNALVVGDPDAEGVTLWYRDDKVGRAQLAGAIVDTRDTREIEDIYSNFTYQFPTNPMLAGSVYLSSLVFRDRSPGEQNAPPEISRGGGSDIGTWLAGPSNVDRASYSRGQLYWAGTQLLYNQHNVAMDFNAILNFGHLDPGRVVIETAEDILENEGEVVTEEKPASYIDTVQGSLFLLDVSYGQTFWRVGTGGAFVSGHDPDPNATRYTGYLDVNADFAFTRFFFDGGPYLVSTGFATPAVQGSGLIAGKAYARFFPTDWLELNLQGAALAAQFDRPEPADRVTGRTYDAVADGAGRYYGTEVDFWMVFSPQRRLHWLAEVDYFVPGNYFRGISENPKTIYDFAPEPDPAWRIAGGFLFY